MAKRLNGEGTIYYLKTRKRWIAAIMVNGEKVVKYCASSEEAKEELQALRTKYNLITYSGSLTLIDWSNEWLYSIKANDVSPKTLQSYAEHIKTCIQPYPISKMRLSEIKRLDMVRHFNTLANKGISKSKFTKLKSILHSLFKDALDLIPKNPMIGVQTPKNARETKRVYSNGNENINAFTQEEQNKLLKELTKEADFKNMILNNVIIFGLGTGMRLGEVLPLNYKKDFNEDYTEVYVRKNLQRIPIYEDKKIIRYELQEVQPKTDGSIRTVPLPAVLTLMIKKQILEIKKNSLSDRYFNNQELLFPNELGGYLDRKRPARLLKTIEERLNLPMVNYHGLRHTYATRLLEAGENIQAISSLLGHYDVSITMQIYTHILEKEKRKAITKLDKIMSLESI